MQNGGNGRKEFLGIVCDLYIIAILAVLPLYTGGTYYLIGDSKYFIFRNVSLFCLGIWLLLTLGAGVWRVLTRRGWEWWKTTATGSSIVDIAMISYSVCVLLSALQSAYTKTAWLGYRDWYMGAVSQLFFVGIYFFISRNYSGSKISIYLGEAALLSVALLSFANRLGIDPLRLFAGYTERDWEYSHMLSTVGNINWLCGYMGVAIAFPLAGYLGSENKLRKVVLFCVSAAGMALLMLQGSDVGIALTAAAILICLLIGQLPLYRRHLKTFSQRGALLAAVTALLIGTIGQMMRLRGTIQAMPADSPLQGRLTWGGWWVISILFFFLCILMQVVPERILRLSMGAVSIVGMLSALGGAVWYLTGHPFTDSWGSSRGSLWAAAWRGFREAGWLQKLIGAGPDCFAEYIYRIMPSWEVSQIEGFWEGSIYANAHNEWLTLLVDVGVLGTAAYLGIFLGALKRYRGMLLAVFALVLYGVNSLVSFQQVLNAPVLFVALGLCEYRLRRENSAVVKND
ncbi:MAG: O-antigen ligase family protein [Acetatifactor sp.]|nr:O-antigen ligase family protein [Acetatifactor sp.]